MKIKICGIKNNKLYRCDLDEIVETLNNRPKMQSVVITGRGAHRTLIEMADTVSEVKNVKHAFESGVKALKGVDW